MTRTNILTYAALLSIVVFSGCSSPPTVGDRMITQSNNTNDLGEQWKTGNTFVKKGEAKKQEGQKLIDEGNDKVSAGNVMITKGQRMMDESETFYKQRFPNGKAF